MPANKKILILAVNPIDTTRLRLDEEVREIKEGLKRANERDLFEIEQSEAVRIRDLRRALLDHKPHIVHFSGHGMVDGIMLEDENGRSVLVEPDALAELFALFIKNVECVILNACFSAIQANAIGQHIRYVVGMNRAIGDKAAIEFAVGFYDALGAGKTIPEAFEFGRNSIRLYRIPEHLTPELLVKKEQPRIFISYKHEADPDESIAMQLAEKFKTNGCYVFVDKDLTAGVKWLKRIDEEIEKADFFIPLLSEHSIDSEMVKAEIQKAHQLSKKHEGKPAILPVRLKYRAPFQYPLNEYLNPIHWVLWDSSEDSTRLLNDLFHAISGQTLPIAPEAQSTIIGHPEATELVKPSSEAQPLCLEMPEGTIDPESKLYIIRLTDKIAMDAIERQGVTITIKGSRQMGKSSLLQRIISRANELNKKTVCLDFQLFDKQSLTNADIFYQLFCTWLTDELGFDSKVDEYWKINLSNSMRCTRYLQRYILQEVKDSLVLAMDEVDTVFDTEFRSDFFGMLRSWHNQRKAGSIWKNLDLVLVTSTEPYQLIENLNQSPFNVGEIINLSDFTREQVSNLNERHGRPFDIQQESRLMDLLNGHPYLTRKAMYLVAGKKLLPDSLFSQAAADQGPFGDHLRYHYYRIYDKEELVRGFSQIISHHTCHDERTFFRLRGAGLVKRDNSKVLPRCALYEMYFKERLHG